MIKFVCSHLCSNMKTDVLVCKFKGALGNAPYGNLNNNNNIYRKKIVGGVPQRTKKSNIHISFNNLYLQNKTK
jgi:hypothetical protein